MTSSRAAGARRRASVLVLAVVALAAVFAAAPAPSATAAEALTAEIVGVSPTVVGPDGTQEVTVRITNDGTRRATDLRADLGVGWMLLSSAAEVSAWADDDSGRTATTQATTSVDDIPAGGSTQVTFELAVAGLQLGDQAAWGPRQMSVEVSAAGAPLVVLHSFLLYDPDGGTADAGTDAPDPVRLALVAPVTGPGRDPASPSDYTDAVVAATAPEQELGRLLSAATDGTAGLSLAVDPAVVAAAGTSSDAGATDWAERLESDGAADVVTLPPYDPDLAALAHAQVGAADMAAATDPTTLLPSGWTPPAAWDTTVAWPQGVTDRATVATAPAAGAQHVLVTDGVEAAPGTVMSTLDTGADEVSLAVADPTWSALVGAATGVDGDGLSAGETRRLLADAAALATSAQTAGTSADVVAALPRGWSPDVEAFESLVSALGSAGWIDIAPLTDVLAGAPSSPTTAPADQVVDDAELPAGQVRELFRAGDDVAAFATVAPDPAELAGTVDRDLVAPLSLAYRTDPEAREAARRLALTRAAEVQSGISVADRGDVTLISDTGDLPVRVRNELPVDATVTVELTPSDPRVIVETDPTVVVPAGGSRDAQVRVRAIGSGDVDLDVELLAPSGVLVADSTSFAVRVRAGWETVGTTVMACAVGLLFVAGIWRTVRRGRSDRRTTGEQVTEAAVPTEPTEGVARHDDLEDPPR
ncbi:DUF6049 family protein [Isoptericola aurantiacus]|uniref:DUF6049 family protein n=1 Tax=Isoptericola aurantiacus TaxID=3377839 RepID=UPI00383A68D0